MATGRRAEEQQGIGSERAACARCPRKRKAGASVGVRIPLYTAKPVHPVSNG